MRGICSLKFYSTFLMQYVAPDDFCEVKTVYSISIKLSGFGSGLLSSSCILIMQS
jgi:hypothetical protein